MVFEDGDKLSLQNQRFSNAVLNQAAFILLH
jgi:hypothetical protein